MNDTDKKSIGTKLWLWLTIVDVLCVLVLLLGKTTNWKLFGEFDYRYCLLYLFWVTPLILVKWCLPNVSKKYISLGIGISFIVACFSWYYLSYRTYYDEQARYYFKQKEYIVALVNDFYEKEAANKPVNYKSLKNAIEKASDNNKAKIEVKYKNESFYIKTNRDAYKPEISVNSEYNPLTGEYSYVSNDKKKIGNFELFYEYRNRPELPTGLQRALLFSSVDKNTNGQLCFLDSSYNSWSKYLDKYLYERSINFWLMFYACFFVAIIISYILGERDAAKQRLIMETEHAKELQSKNDELDTAYKKLTRFKLMYQKMFEEYETAGIADNKQILQTMDFSWEEIITAVLKTERHDLKNALDATSKTIDHKLQYIYEKVIEPFKNQILQNLQQLPNIISYDTNPNTKVVDLIIYLETALNPLVKTFENDSDLQFNYKKDLPEIIFETCDINMYRMKSMVFNVLTNANQECNRRYAESLLSDLEYTSKITLCFSLLNLDTKRYLSIKVIDNAGGIPKSIFEDLYFKPVKSGDLTKERDGEGTMYVAFFAKYMNIKILKKNWSDDNDTGAIITLLIPLKEAVR